MQRRTSRQLKQLSLHLQVESACRPVQYESEALLQALADLLLEALGKESAENQGEKEGSDEVPEAESAPHKTRAILGDALSRNC